MTDRLPPFSEEAERGVLGCILADPHGLDVCMERFRAAGQSIFYETRHQMIYAAMAAISATKQALDPILLFQHLKDAGELEKVGGLLYLGKIQDDVPSAANLTHYMDIVWEKFQHRRIIAWASETASAAWEQTKPVAELLADIESRLELLTAPASVRAERRLGVVLADEVEPMIERHYSRGQTQLDGLPTGLNYLDKVMLGIRSTDYVVLAARPGEGKTSLGLNIAMHLARDYVQQEEVVNAETGEVQVVEKRGIPVGIFTLEMTEDSLGFRLVFARAGVPSSSFREGFATKKAFNDIGRAMVDLKEANIILDGDPDQSMDVIASKARRWVREYGIKLFVLDYLQLLDGDDDRDRVRFLRKASKKIVSLKKRLGVPWLVLAQMNRNIETADRARRPVLSDLKESGSIEQDADKIIFLYHPLKQEGIEEDEELIANVCQAKKLKWDETPRRINAMVAKNRHGPTGVAELLFQNNICLFSDWHLWKVERGQEGYKQGERASKLGKSKISDEDVP